ncbi:hypothetical protein I7I48_09046 [Histoplasma ohiense]|nr:hypothetical protein I7I48_09046 [Histoplasma ohiense (nom. inval.)]
MPDVSYSYVGLSQLYGNMNVLYNRGCRNCWAKIPTAETAAIKDEGITSSTTYEHREWKIGLPVRSAILKPLYNVPNRMSSLRVAAASRVMVVRREGECG